MSVPVIATDSVDGDGLFGTDLSINGGSVGFSLGYGGGVSGIATYSKLAGVIPWENDFLRSRFCRCELGGGGF